MPVERRGLTAQQVLANRGGRGEMIKAPIQLQDLRRRLYVKAKAEPTWRFWGLYVHVCKRETLWEAYQLAKQNDGAPGIDGVTFQAIEAEVLEKFLEQLREELVQRRYRPRRLRKVRIPKEGGKTRQLSSRRAGGWIYSKEIVSDFSALSSVASAVDGGDGCRCTCRERRSGRHCCAGSS